jgi:hypothetical protein
LRTISKREMQLERASRIPTNPEIRSLMEGALLGFRGAKLSNWSMAKRRADLWMLVQFLEQQHFLFGSVRMRLSE